ncbi:MAG: hypothetical protein HOB82_05830 [Alphaproteobacteria bacterium]|jgi:hypothetical protein|nr:hypothetical protein [Alphaproteobacteria bacterium]MBT4711028.1 hypothetical protein [Alphaproteobacteria bacterium]MBT5860564.1 hypothetical protein [Alphaproteobacteria bacterium]
MNQDTSPYRAGVCNIGTAEIRARRIAGWASAAVASIVWAALAAFDVGAAWYWVVALPAFGAAVGFVQARFHFCVNFGLRQVFNFDGLGSTTRVEDADEIRRDRRRSLELIAVSAVLAFAVAAAAVATA